MLVARFILMTLICVGLAACGGGGGSVPASEVTPYGGKLPQATEVTDYIDDLRDEVPAIPVQGTATYKGSAHFSDYSGMDRIGNIKLIADFSASSITGRMDNFTSAEGERLGDYIDISRGEIEAAAFGGTLSGKIDNAQANGVLSGKFYGANIPAIGGDFKVSADGSDFLKGDFSAKKQGTDEGVE